MKNQGWLNKESKKQMQFEPAMVIDIAEKDFDDKSQILASINDLVKYKE